MDVSARVRFDLEARASIKRGFDAIANIAQVTLGPIGGVVAVERIAQRNKSPELLDDVATISRRIIGIPDAFENMGAMLARHVAWNVREEIGDGSAIALVIAQAMIAEAVRYIAAGHNAMSLWQGIKKGQAQVEARLEELAQPLEDAERIAALATSIVKDKRLGQLIEEIFDIVGPKGFVEVRGAYGMESDREYVEGVYWDAGWISPYFADKGNELQATVERPYILVTDRFVESAQELIPALEAVRRAEGKSLVVIAGNVKDSALNLMVANNAKGTMRLLGLKAPRYGDMRTGALEDIAIATGARFVRKDAGDLVSRVTISDLGRARYVVCNRSTFTIVGTMGSPQAIREQIRTLQNNRSHLQEKEDRKNVDERIGKLLGGAALLHVSGQTEAERNHRKQLAEDAIRVVRMGLQGGVVAGGCAAYMTAASALDEVEVTEEEAPALDILRTGLRAPLTCLVRNAGYDPGPAVHRIAESPPGWGFDVMQGRVVDMLETNIVDPLPMVRAALSYGASAATMAMTTDVLVYRSYRDKSPELEP
jgi:chaperonin GroEL